MSKADGTQIAIKFTEDLLGDVTGLSPAIGYTYQTLTGAVTASSNYSGYPPTRAADGSTSTQWVVYPFTAGTWFKVQFGVAEAFPKWRMYCASSAWRPTSVVLQGSNDGTNWTDISTHAPAAVDGWQEFNTNNTAPYLYYRLYMNTAANSEVDIYEIQFCDKPTGNEQAFVITGKEYNYVPNGALVDKAYYISSVDGHPTEDNTILLTVVANNKFESAVGDLAVSYDAAKGNLRGRAGLVSTFSKSFTPDGLAAKPDQNDAEHIDVSVTSTGTMTEIYYTTTVQEMGRIEISEVAASGVLTNVNNL